MQFTDFDTTACIETMSYDSVASVPSFVKDEDRLRLLAELREYEPEPAPQVTGRHKVRQEYLGVRDFREGSLFLELKNALGTYLGAKLNPYLAVPLRFSEVVAQTYEPGPVGITPHRDGESRIGIVALLVLEGRARFCTCEDRSGRNALPHLNDPGTLLLMRAPGFLCSSEQPFHFVDRIEKRRTTVGLRQKAER